MSETNTQSKAEIVIYKDKEGPEVRVRFEGETAWLSLQQLAELFDRDKSVISRHIKNVFSSAELSQKATVAKIATVQIYGRSRSSKRRNSYL